MSTLEFKRHFTDEDIDVWSTVQWYRTKAEIKSDTGKEVFKEDDIEAPMSWSDRAVNIVASKYFRGKVGSPEREKSVRGLIERVVHTITRSGVEQGYFDGKNADVFEDELTYILLHQMAAFNSPVWFNVGVEPGKVSQASACFILDVEDSMESILEWYRQEAMLFKNGSGAGVNVSKLRGSQENLSSGGVASGPLSFMKAADASAGVIKSGGKTRRASKMVQMDVDHPDILEFILCKIKEEEKAKTLVEAGFDGGIGGDAYSACAYQNSNHAVRLTDEFMRAVEANRDWNTTWRTTGGKAHKYNARELLSEIAEAVTVVGDPGINFHDTINTWHTCKESGDCVSSNPCTEFQFLNNSACNLASIKLTAFYDGKEFDWGSFSHTIQILITAMDILVDAASYPTEKIRENSHKFRPLGLGYTDLGALLMRMGYPYDSEEAREWAAIITAGMTSEAYFQSVMIAKELEAFEEYEKNKDSFLKVLEYHLQACRKLRNSPSYYYARIALANAIDNVEQWGVRNAQVTLLAPTGTISFMMDCDTLGIEPEYSLVKTKKMVDGGVINLVNGSVEDVMKKLGTYTFENSQYLEEKGTLEGCAGITDDQLAIFDCAVPPANGTRCISPMGHLKMMEAVQPFLSGAISKTCNLPAGTTADEVEKLIIEAWKMGLKAITFYVDGSKATQPLNVKREVKPEKKGEIVRRRLTDDCISKRHRFEFGGLNGYIHVGLYDNGAPGEIFLRVAKSGSSLSGLIDALSIAVSIALQSGVPLKHFVRKFSFMRFEPSGFTNNPQVPIAKSLVDYVFRYLGYQYLSEEEQKEVGLLNGNGNGHSITEEFVEDVSDAVYCLDCGAVMVRAGTCYTCASCGSSSGCG